MPTLSTIGAACARAWGFTSGLVKDQYFNLVSLLLPGNGTNGAQNNTFLDGSSNNFTITRNGNTTQGTFSPFSQTGWSNYYNGSGYFSSSTALFAYTTGNASTQTFTIEAMVYHTARTTPVFQSYAQCIAGKGNVYMNFGINGTGNLILLHNDGTDRIITSSSTVPLNTWTYVAIVVSGGTATMYIGNSSVGTGTWYGIAAGAVSSASYFGKAATASDANVFQGYISNLRVSSVARTAAIPTSGYANDANTVFLFNSSNQFVDKSSNGYAITVASSGTSVTPFSPFAPTAKYETATVGGSGYFDGTGDYLSIADNAAFTMGTGDFTIEAWVYCTATDFASSRYIIAQRNASADTSISFAINLVGGGARKVRLLCFDSGGASYEAICASDVINLNEWTHIAGVRNGATLRIYVNGVQQGTANISTASLVDSDGGVAIGRLGDANFYYWLGYISNVRVTKGGCLYPSGTQFTPPAAPLTTTVSAGTVSLLTNFTNAGVVDATAKNVLETVGNAQISTTQSKWGGGSIYLDGTSNTYVRGPVQIYLGSSNFTIEGWVRFNSIPGAEFDIYKIQDKNDGSSFGALRLILNSSMKLKFLASTTGSSWGISVDNLGNTLSTGVWYYIAITRSGSDFKVYVNGSQAGATQTLSGALYAGPINALGWNGVTTYSNMYFDDVRLTVGLVRDVTTSPTAPFPVQ